MCSQAPNAFHELSWSSVHRWYKITFPLPGEPWCQLFATTPSRWYWAKLKEQNDTSMPSPAVSISHKNYTCYQGPGHPQSTVCLSKSCPQRFIFNHLLCSTSTTRNLTGVASESTQVSGLGVIFYELHLLLPWPLTAIPENDAFLGWGSILHV